MDIQDEDGIKGHNFKKDSTAERKMLPRALEKIC